MPIKLKLKLFLLLQRGKQTARSAVACCVCPSPLLPSRSYVRFCLLVASASLRHLSECHVSYLVSFVLIVNNCRNFLLLYVILRMKRSFRLAQTPLLLLLLLLLSLQPVEMGTATGDWQLELATGDWQKRRQRLRQKQKKASFCAHLKKRRQRAEDT